MIVEARKEFLEEIVDFSWDVSNHKDKSSFPKFKDYSNMYDIFSKSFDEENKLLVCYENGHIVGTLNLLIEEDNRFIQSLGGVYAKKDFNHISSQFIDYLKVSHRGYELYSGYSKDNRDAINFFEYINAELVESSMTMKLRYDDFKVDSIYNEVTLLEENRYEEYSIFHDEHNNDIYWSSKRIYENIHNWRVHVIIHKGNIIASIFIKVNDELAEVYGISIDNEYKDKGLELKLISKSLQEIFKEGIKDVLYFVDDNEKDILNATLNVGFKYDDTYSCYKLKL